jgi:glycosyltransferase involved in cell wall biosynthesis
MHFMKQPFFSIIIPALNEAKYLPHLLKDLSQQSFRDFEVIVVDGHSEDKTVELAKSFISKLPSLTILNSEKRHVCTQRNLGAGQAKGEVLIFSDADNRLPTYFLQGIKYRLESESMDVGSTWFQPDKLTPSSELISTAMNLGLELQNSIKPHFLLESLIIIRRKAHSLIGGFDEAINYDEGNNFINKANKFNLIVKTFHDPIYYYSIRRFRKFGILKVLGGVATMELSTLLGPEIHDIHAKKIYPMLGGSIFSKNYQRRNRFIRNIKKFFKEF